LLSFRDKNETLAQNYRRLGLVARLRAPAGGTETPLHGKATVKPTKSNPFNISTIGQSIVSEAKVERDADGKIIRVLHRGATNPLNDPLNDLDSGSDDEMEEEEAPEWGGIVDEGETTEVVKSLVEESRNPVEKKPRTQSEQEQEWLQRLVAKHGDDYAAMARDLKLNPMQQTAADLKRRIKKMQGSA
jgi:nucleolar protein 16